MSWTDQEWKKLCDYYGIPDPDKVLLVIQARDGQRLIIRTDHRVDEMQLRLTFIQGLINELKRKYNKEGKNGFDNLEVHQ